ncbi:TPA: hypothetical protein N0F65_002152 [Lagenidium giganteum]|uniref:Uncharacterized protein n=1 Tax=Lagenidium giganteum TaxID=4803 RepID=A0AAV2YKE6_9STRA|nr:TPA: hypothetical protein N0F65_002152 [Lagenidium giganteum]
MKKSDEDPLVRSAALSPRLTPVNKRSPTLLDPHHVHLGRQPNQVENDDDVAATTDTSPALPSDMYEPVHVPTYIAFMVFGLASWIMTNSESLPYIGALSTNCILFITLFSHAQRLLMMFTWDVTANVLGANHSVAMLFWTHMGGMVSATTSVVFYPYVATFPQEPYAEKMKFSVSTFYSICGLLVLSSFIAFMYLEYHPTARRIRKRHMDNDDDTAVEDSEKGASTAKSDEGASDEAKLIAKKVKANNIQVRRQSGTGLESFCETESLFSQPEDEAASTNDTSANLRRQVFSALWRELACLTLLAALGYGMLPSTSSFLFARYAPTNQPQLASQYQTYCSVTTLVVDPLARFVTSFVRVYSVYLFTWLLLLGGSFLLACSMISAPPFSGDDSPNGYLFPLLSSIAFAAVYAYTQTMLFLAIKREMDRVRNPQYSELAYQWSGMLIQIGAFAGTMAIFPLTVIYPELFQSHAFTSPPTKLGAMEHENSLHVELAPTSEHEKEDEHARKMQQLQTEQRRNRVATFLAFACFGLASWVMTNATYIELGVFLQVLPESYGIYAYSIFALQSANIYPLLYMLLNSRQQRMKQTTMIWILLVIGVLVSLLMSLLWDHTAVVFGAEHSVAMLLLTHLGGLVSATSSVVFYPYVATFPPLYTSGLSTGEGMSGSIAALLGVIQEPYSLQSMRFTVGVFYSLCAVIMVFSLLGFAFLQFHPRARAAMEEGQAKHAKADEESPLVPEEQVTIQAQSSLPSRKVMLGQVWQFLFCQLLLAAFAFGILPSVMPYVYKKYAPANDKEGATSRYQTVASIAALILDPLARLVTSWWRLYHVRALCFSLSLVAAMLLVFSLVAHPLWSSHGHGHLLPLISHISFLAIYAYTQTMIYLTLKRESDNFVPEYAHQVYQWSGFATQIGAFMGAAIIFPMIFFNEKMFLG